jgi:hypothetical protein
MPRNVDNSNNININISKAIIDLVVVIWDVVMTIIEMVVVLEDVDENVIPTTRIEDLILILMLMRN